MLASSSPTADTANAICGCSPAPALLLLASTGARQLHPCHRLLRVTPQTQEAPVAHAISLVQVTEHSPGCSCNRVTQANRHPKWLVSVTLMNANY